MGSCIEDQKQSLKKWSRHVQAPRMYKIVDRKYVVERSWGIYTLLETRKRKMVGRRRKRQDIDIYGAQESAVDEMKMHTTLSRTAVGDSTSLLSPQVTPNSCFPLRTNSVDMCKWLKGHLRQQGPPHGNPMIPNNPPHVTTEGVSVC